MSIADKQQEILEELSFFPDWQERYEYVIGLGRKLAPMPDDLKSADKLIKGCQSQVWLDAAAEQAVNDRSIVLLLFVGDPAAPRAKIRLADLLRQGARPLNLLRLAGQPVRILLDDPNAVLTGGSLQLEVTIEWG